MWRCKITVFAGQHNKGYSISNIPSGFCQVRSSEAGACQLVRGNLSSRNCYFNLVSSMYVTLMRWVNTLADHLKKEWGFLVQMYLFTYQDSFRIFKILCHEKAYFCRVLEKSRSWNTVSEIILPNQGCLHNEDRRPQNRNPLFFLSYHPEKSQNVVKHIPYAKRTI